MANETEYAGEAAVLGAGAFDATKLASDIAALEAEKKAALERSGYADKFTIYRDTGKKWRWRRKAPNGEIVGAAHEGYFNFSDARENMERNTMGMGYGFPKFDVEVEE